MPKKFLIVIINLLICYLIIKISYARLLLITKLIFISIKFEIFRKKSYIYNGSANFKTKIKPN